MAMDILHSSGGRSNLWNRNFSFLVIANLLLHAAVYMLFPVFHHWMVRQWHCSDLYAGGVTAVFGISLFLPGLFNNYLVDTYKRQSVCIRSILLLALISLAYPYVEHFQTLWLLWMIQGAAFAVVLMATGSTLVIDVTPSQKRNQANVCFTWAGIFGMIAGLMGGYHAETLLTFPQLTYCSAFLSVGAILLISMVTVTFRAPLELPLLSFDRFILFRSLGPGLNMMAVPFVLGMILSTIYDSFFYLCIGGGFICFLFLKAATVTRADGRLLVTIGQLLTGAGLLVLYYSDAGIHLWGAGFLIGLGAAASISQFLFVMIQLPLHCERGTGYHTYQLLWELGILLGVMSGKWTAATPSGNPFIVALVVCLVGLIAYQLAVNRYYRKQMERRKI